MINEELQSMIDVTAKKNVVAWTFLDGSLPFANREGEIEFYDAENYPIDDLPEGFSFDSINGYATLIYENDEDIDGHYEYVTPASFFGKGQQIMIQTFMSGYRDE